MGKEERYDIIIVGGGHNGTTTAAYLAKCGLSVCVLEERPECGGAQETCEPIAGVRIQPHAIARGILRVASFFTAFAVAAVSVRVVLGGFMDRGNRYVICLVSLAGYAVLLLATRDVTGTTLPLLGGLLGIVHGFFMPTFMALTLSGAGDTERGRIVALLSGSFNVGFGFGTPV